MFDCYVVRLDISMHLLTPFIEWANFQVQGSPFDILRNSIFESSRSWSGATLLCYFTKRSLTVWALYAYFSDFQNAAFELLVWRM